MIKKKNLYIGLIFSAIFFSMIAYENHIFGKYYSKLQFIVTGIIFAIFFIFMIYEKKLKKSFSKIVNKNICLLFMFALMIISTILGFFLYGYNSFMSIASVIGVVICALTTYIIIPLLCLKYPIIEKMIFAFFTGFSFFLAVFAICMKINNNHLLGYSLVNVRNASIYYDPNFLGMILGTAFLYLIIKFENKFIKLMLVIIFGYAIYLTGSRGTILALCVAIFAFLNFFLKMKPLKKVTLLVLIAIIIIYGLRYLYNSDYFRTFQGSNNRAEMWEFALEEIKKSPFFGFGYQSVGNYLLSNGFQNTSTHNSLFDFLFGYGIIATTIYLYFLLKVLVLSLRKLKKEQYKYIFPLIFMLVNSNTILYSFGGVGISSFIFTFVLGILNIKLLNIDIEGELNDL